MADAFDVMDQLAALVTSAVYPNGTSSASVTGTDITIGSGWPEPGSLDAALSASKSFVSVFELPGASNASRYPIQQQQIGATPSPTLIWTVSGVTATLAGTVSTPQNVAIIVDHVAYAYAVQAGDTLTSIAAALAALIAANRTCTSSGPVITIPGSSQIVARVGVAVNVAAEWVRQKGRFLITVWAATPTNRRSIQGVIKTALAQVHFINMPDGFGARLRYANDWPVDSGQKSILYRHDITYEVEYATTVSSTAAQAIVWTVDVYGGVIPPNTNPQIYNF
jgi:hypothetical protein